MVNLMLELVTVTMPRSDSSKDNDSLSQQDYAESNKADHVYKFTMYIANWKKSELSWHVNKMDVRGLMVAYLEIHSQIFRQWIGIDRMYVYTY